MTTTEQTSAILFDTEDAFFIRLLAARQRVQSARAVGLHATAHSVMADALNEVEAWLAGAVQLEQLAAERERVPHETVAEQLSRWNEERNSGSPF